MGKLQSVSQQEMLCLKTCCFGNASFVLELEALGEKQAEQKDDPQHRQLLSIYYNAIQYEIERDNKRHENKKNIF